MLDLNIEERGIVLDAYSSEIEDLQAKYNEHLITGFLCLDKGDVREANIMLLKLASIERQLTYIKECLSSEYKQAVSLH